MNYVKCIDDSGYEGSLHKGRVYRRLLTEPSVSDNMIRVVDETYGEAGSEQGYLFAANRFEPVELASTNAPLDDSLTVNLPESIKGILYAEALMAQTSMSALVRQWIEERLDLPEPSH